MHKKYVTLFFMVMEEVAHTTELCHLLLPYLTTMHMITIRQIQKKKKAFHISTLRVGISDPNCICAIYLMEQN